MLCVITYICKDEKYHIDSDHRKKVNNVIKTLFHGLSEDEIDFNQYLFWNEYTESGNKNSYFDGDEFIWKIKDIRYCNSDLWNKKYLLPCTKVIGFVSCIDT